MFNGTYFAIAFLTFVCTLGHFDSSTRAEEGSPTTPEMAWVVNPNPESGTPGTYALLKEGEYRISTYDNLMRSICHEEGTDWRLMSAIAYHESRFTPDVVSSRGAQGLMQIMPVVAQQYNVPVEALLDPATNVRVASQLMKGLEKMMKIPASTPYEDRLSLILAAYNGGIGHISDARRLAHHYGEDPNSWASVSRYLELKAQPEYYTHQAVRCGRFTGYKQTHAYVRDVMHRYNRYRTLASQ